MKFERSSGILLHPTSLPGPYGIGDLGPQAHRFVDWLAGAGCKLWQVLPLGPTGYGDSPYQCFSAFAGNFLMRDGLLHANDLVERTHFPANQVDYGAVIPWKLNLLERAFTRFSASPDPALQKAFEVFCAENASWLEDYGLFMAIKESHGGGSWENWPAPLRRREPQALAEAQKTLTEHVSRFMFYQFLFFRQWHALKTNANEHGIRIIGDIPIFVAYDSADVWAHPDLFFLDNDRRPTVVAGVPPDYFSPTGQLWGNPLYRWDVHQNTGYKWWLERFQAILKMVDLVRLDHFRGFAGYWEIPAGSPTAETGRWVPGPGADFFKSVQKVFSPGGVEEPALNRNPEHSEGVGEGLPIIAEDLGVITPDVDDLRTSFNLPGMKVLQFAFTAPDNPFLPHHYPQNCVVYTGTHDNDTARGWFEAASGETRDFACRYLNTDGRDFAWDLIRAAWSSVAVYSLSPMQDLLDLGTEARMNYPSRPSGNWGWRMDENALSDELQAKMGELNYLYQR